MPVFQEQEILETVPLEGALKLMWVFFYTGLTNQISL